MWYTIRHRRKGSKRMYRCGYRTRSKAEIEEMAQFEVQSGDYTTVEIINADTDDIIEHLIGGRKRV